MTSLNFTKKIAMGQWGNITRYNFKVNMLYFNSVVVLTLWYARDGQELGSNSYRMLKGCLNPNSMTVS